MFFVTIWRKKWRHKRWPKICRYAIPARTVPLQAIDWYVPPNGSSNR